MHNLSEMKKSFMKRRNKKEEVQREGEEEGECGGGNEIDCEEA